ncbi:hypothetical protein ALP97_200256 [Pseudomonas salomonii]|uniref:Uncharacterized protein n=1 Tax=Pseudomonas salomonii TaxID=191391 RepID=A0A3M4QBX4_9PSED|nr:hypothetical protein ALP97_200256 [Pseudomonas salomonii]
MPEGVAQPACLPVVKLDGLVDDIPGDDLAAVAADHCGNMLRQYLLRVGGCHRMRDPVGQGAVPTQCVAEHALMVRLRKRDNTVHWCEGVAVRGGVDLGPFQRVFRHHDARLPGHEVPIRRVGIELGGIYREAEREPMFDGDRAQGPEGVFSKRRANTQKRREGHGPQCRSEETSAIKGLHGWALGA